MVEEALTDLDLHLRCDLRVLEQTIPWRSLLLEDISKRSVEVSTVAEAKKDVRLVLLNSLARLPARPIRDVQG